MHLQALHAQYLFNDASVCVIVSLSLYLSLSLCLFVLPVVCMNEAVYGVVGACKCWTSASIET